MGVRSLAICIIAEVMDPGSRMRDKEFDDKSSRTIGGIKSNYSKRNKKAWDGHLGEQSIDRRRVTDGQPADG